MKKRFIILLMMLGFNVFVHAQNGFWYGLSMGAQNTLLSSTASSEIDVKKALRPITTLDIEYRFSRKIAIQSGLGYALYTQNTSKFKNDFDYLVIPLYIKFGKFKKQRRFAFSGLIGLNYKWLLSANNIYEGGKNDISKFTTNAHIDFTTGLGIKHKIKNNFLFETHLIGATGLNFNKSSFDGFNLTNNNFGVIFSVKHIFSIKKDD